MGDGIDSVGVVRGWRGRICRHFGARIAAGSARELPQFGTNFLLAATAVLLIAFLGACQRQEKATPAAGPSSAVPAELHSGTLSTPALAPAGSGVVAELHGGKLSTPESFQARCGQASSLVQMPSGPTLRYDTIHLLVVFPGSTHLIPRFQAEDTAAGSGATTLRNVDEAYALERLHCGK
jgi:hypothetical protein